MGGTVLFVSFWSGTTCKPPGQDWIQTVSPGLSAAAQGVKNDRTSRQSTSGPLWLPLGSGWHMLWPTWWSSHLLLEHICYLARSLGEGPGYLQLPLVLVILQLPSVEGLSFLGTPTSWSHKWHKFCITHWHSGCIQARTGILSSGLTSSLHQGDPQ